MFKFLLTAIASLFIATTGVNANELLAAQGRAHIENVQAASEYRTVITSDFGGSVVEYIERFNKLRQSGAKVRIDDLCMSACTLATGLLEDANVCVSKYAILAFHSAWVMTMVGPMYHEEGTRILWNIYPDKVKEKLRAAGWEGGEHPNFIYFKGTDFYPLCD